MSNIVSTMPIYILRKSKTPCGSAGKESACNSVRPGFDPWFGKILWRSERLPTPVLWPGKFHELYSPWGRKESDMTKGLSLLLLPKQEDVIDLSLLPIDFMYET